MQPIMWERILKVSLCQRSTPQNDYANDPEAGLYSLEEGIRTWRCQIGVSLYRRVLCEGAPFRCARADDLFPASFQSLNSIRSQLAKIVRHATAHLKGPVFLGKESIKHVSCSPSRDDA